MCVFKSWRDFTYIYITLTEECLFLCKYVCMCDNLTESLKILDCPLMTFQRWVGFSGLIQQNLQSWTLTLLSVYSTLDNYCKVMVQDQQELISVQSAEELSIHLSILKVETQPHTWQYKELCGFTEMFGWGAYLSDEGLSSHRGWWARYICGLSSAHTRSPLCDSDCSPVAGEAKLRPRWSV